MEEEDFVLSMKESDPPLPKQKKKKRKKNQLSRSQRRRLGREKQEREKAEKETLIERKEARCKEEVEYYVTIIATTLNLISEITHLSDFSNQQSLRYDFLNVKVDVLRRRIHRANQAKMAWEQRLSNPNLLNIKMRNRNLTHGQHKANAAKMKANSRASRRRTSTQSYEGMDSHQDDVKDLDYTDSGDEYSRKNKKWKRKRSSRRGRLTSIQSSLVSECDVDREGADEAARYNTSEKYKWIFELQKLDPEVEEFKYQHLVCVGDGICKKLMNKSLAQVTAMGSLRGETIFSLKRCPRGQVYIISNLSSTCHFALGRNAMSAVSKIFSLQSFNGYEEKISSLNSQIVHCHSVSGRNNESSVTTDTVLMDKVLSIAKKLLPLMVEMTPESKNRVDISMSLGLTDQRCNRYTSFTLFGHLLPDLITPHAKVDDEVLTSLGDIGLYFSKVIIPQHNISDAYPSDAITHKFAKQLKVPAEEYSAFRVSAITVILPGKLLRPHCDVLNARRGTHDYTCQVMVPVSISSLDSDTQKRCEEMYGTKLSMIPVTVLFYPRRCVSTFINRNRLISDYCDHPKEHVGRHILAGHFKDMGRTYHQQTFSAGGYSKIELSCKKVDRDRLNYDGMGYTVNELCDKMSWWSIIIMSYLVFAMVHGIYIHETIEVILFFVHQCNGSTLFVQAMKELTADHDTVNKELRSKRLSKRVSFYRLLALKCIDLKGLCTDMSIDDVYDVGSTGMNRFQTSGAKLFSETEVGLIVSKLEVLFSEYREKHEHVSSSSETKKAGIIQRFTLVKRILGVIQNDQSIRNVRVVRSNHLVSMASLLGLLPLSFYVYHPPHLEGGPGRFLINEMNIDAENISEDGLIDWFSDLILQTQEAFNRDVTPNIMEQTFCIAGRANLRWDHWLFYIRYIGGTLIQDGSKFTKGCFTDYPHRLQCFFRVNGKRCSNWQLDMFNGVETVTLFSNSRSSTDSIRWDFRRKRLIFMNNFKM